MRTTLRLLGPIEMVRADGEVVDGVLSQPKRLAVLAYLAIASPTGFVRRDAILGVFWPSKDEERARNALRQALHFLRRELGEDLFEARGTEEVRIAPGALDVDVHALEASLARGDADEVAQRYRGPLMEGFATSAREFDDWLDGRRESLRRRVWTAIDEGSTTAETEGRTEVAIALAAVATRVRPLHERSSRRLIRLYAEAGDRTSALQEYERLSVALREAFEVVPDAETEALTASLRAASSRIGSPPTSLGAAHGPSGTQPPHESAGVEPAAVRKSAAADRWPPGHHSRRLGPAAVGLAALALLLTAGAIRSSVGDQERGPPALEETFVVSTPSFLGEGRDEYVLRGVQVELESGLAAGGARLVPPAAVREAEAKGHHGVELARGLGARYEIEATLQEFGGRMRVTVAVVDWHAAEVRRVERFEVAGEDVLTLRARIAERLAGRLPPAPSPARLGYSALPADLAQRYLAARGRLPIAGPRQQARWREASALLESITEEAPGFAAGWASLALLRFRMFWLSADPSREGIAVGEGALERARELDPTGLDTRVAEAFHAYHVLRNWDLAVERARGVAELLPGDAEATLLWAMAERRRGRYESTVSILESRLREYPSEIPNLGFDLLGTYEAMGRDADADRLAERLARETGQSCALRYHRTQRLDGFGAALDGVARTCWPNGMSGPRAFWHEHGMGRPDAALEAVDRIAAARAAEGLDPEWMAQQWAPFPLDFWRGRAWLLAGDTVRSRAAFARHVPELRRWVAELPDDYLRRRFLLLAYAGAGLSEEARSEEAALLRVAEGSGDMFAGFRTALHGIAEARVLLRDQDGAIATLIRLQSLGSAPHLAPAELRTNPTWASLRDHPGFQALTEAGHPRVDGQP